MNGVSLAPAAPIDPPNWIGTEDTDRGPWLETHTGRRFYPLDPRPEDVELDDIAWHLSRIHRFNGASDVPITVAEHSIDVMRRYEEHWPATPRKELLAVLLHDAAEAYIGDIPRPVKRALDMAAPGVFMAVESAIVEAVYRKFEVPYPDSNCLKQVDNEALAFERATYWPRSTSEWPNLPKVAPQPGRQPLDWRDAYYWFSRHALALIGGRTA